MTLEILSLLDYVFKKLVGLAEENLESHTGIGKTSEKNQGEGEESKGSHEEGIEKIKKDKIVPYMLDLLFEQLVTAMDALTYEDILFHYWDLELVLGVQPDVNIFN